MARILIAGCGDIGAAAGQRLAGDGHDVVGLKRHPPASDSKIMYVKADLSSYDDVEKVDSDFDLVIYILTPDQRSEQSYRCVFEAGVTNLLNFFSDNNPDTRFIFVSSTSVYGQAHGEWVDEESATEPGRVTGKILLQAEKAFLDHCSRNCIIRYSGIYGGNRSRLLDMVARGGEVQYQPPYYTNRIHREDCIAVLRFIANRMIAGDDLEPVYLASDDDPAAKWDVYSYLADRLGIGQPEMAILPQGSDQNKRCSNSRLKQLGYSFIYKSYREGYDSVEQKQGRRPAAR
jgi:nucleoside-diphosphate-sugar epimerase